MQNLIELFVQKFSSPLGIGILIGFPVLYTLAGMVLKRRKRADKPITAPIIMRRLVLPMLAVHLTIRYLFEFSHDHIMVKLTQTVLSIVILSFLFSAINYLFFSENNILTRKETIPKLGRDVLNVILTLIFGSVVLSQVWGFDLANLLTALGVSSLVIGLALQEPLSNLFQGISMLMARPFQKNDWVQIGDEKGKVVDFTWRSVKLLNRDNELIIVPNNSIGRLHIKNLSRPSPIHAEHVNIGFSYQDDPIEVKSALMELALNTKGILHDPPPQPMTLSYDDFYIKYGLKFYIQDFEDEIILKDRLMTKLFEMAAQKGFNIPFPIRELRNATPQ